MAKRRAKKKTKFWASVRNAVKNVFGKRKVKGYVRKDGKHVAGYKRKPKASRAVIISSDGPMTKAALVEKLPNEQS